MTSGRTPPLPPAPSPRELDPLFPLQRSENPRNAISWRSVLLGLAGTIFICGLTPYNDYALNNTFLVGNNLPLGVVMFLFGFAVVVNGPLWKWKPRYALTAGELTVALSMTLVSCALPSSGLMRYFPASLIMPFWDARSDVGYRRLLESLNLPPWILPTMGGRHVADWANSPVVTGYHERWTGPGPIPYAAWMRPALTWGVFLAALFGALLCLVAIVRRQWFENERLPFPLATIYLSLVDEPQPGRYFSRTLATRSFWIAITLIFFIHLWNGAAQYLPQHFPRIPVWYDLSNVLTEPPWAYADFKLKNAAVFFTVVGVTYFLPGAIAFSLWAFFLLEQARHMVLGTLSGDPTVYGWQDEHFGGILAFAAVVLWIGRRHWRLVVAQALRGARPGEPRGRYVPYPLALWGLLCCCIVMAGWLVAAGSTVTGACVMVAMLLLLFIIITRIIAETGLVLGQLQVGLYRPWQLLAIYGWTDAVPLKTFYLTALVNGQFYDFREVLSVYASHGLKVADQTMLPATSDDDDSAADRRRGRRLIALMALALLVGYAVSFTSTLWTEYRYAATRDVSARAPINDWGTDISPKRQILDPTQQYGAGDYHVGYSPAGHVAFGFAFTTLLGFLRLRYAWWPLHPVGYLMVGTYPEQHLWLSIFLGWAAKAVIVRLGGSRLYTHAKPFFLGLIVGESMAAGFWLVMGIVLGSMNLPYRPINIMPG